ncbi:MULTISPECIES: DNA repair exonuclease [unclassified Parafrankia]|uniref:metallophosphoesterase family protein n=1 Tax=unclassified Parafrankia TaxID=2994368 RepID=UPI000DA5585D|nr:MULTISPECIES: DNA repair exonuclease [unclassified Parafrankia]TCJ35926.1 DNA repair exonuclease [Parafrankia sp. BMG5.11]CAI7979220.1 DNA repair protein SbcD/Mre11 [Frankia sp. Hr75.2]SQD95544.1 Metallophosphoesterase [Parafrankia sp. Ea1.12]
MRLVHAADIHLDSPLRGLTRLGDGDLAHLLRQATRRALANLVDLSVDRAADALLLAGDVYDGTWRDYATGRFFVEQMGRLRDADIPVYMISGNHDAESEITRSLTLPPNVRVFASDRPGTHVADDLGLAVHGQSYATAAVHDNLVQRYPDALAGLVNVGLLHTAADGAEGHANYAPCSEDDLARTGYDYFALGHVHSHRVVHGGPLPGGTATRGDGPGGRQVAAFSGNLQGRTPRESGPKGALVVEIPQDGPARIEHVPCDVARWAVLTVDTAGADTLDDVLGRVTAELRAARDSAGDRPVVARTVLTGASRAAAGLADAERLREELRTVADGLQVCLEKIVNRVTDPRPAGAVDPELVAAVRAACDDLGTRPEDLAQWIGPLDREVGRLLRGADLLDLGDPRTLADLARRAGDGLLARLSGDDA